MDYIKEAPYFTLCRIFGHIIAESCSAFRMRWQASCRQIFPSIAALLIQKKLNLLNSTHLAIQ